MNKQIDFYILNDELDRLQFACQLIEKAYKQKHRIYIQCNDEKSTHEMDNHLWLFKASSFVPHNIQGEGPTPPPPIQIGHNNTAPGFTDVLLNLSQEVPPFHQQFKRIVEIVDSNEQRKEALRKHYRFYQSQSYLINNHKI